MKSSTVFITLGVCIIVITLSVVIGYDHGKHVGITKCQQMIDQSIIDGLPFGFEDGEMYEVVTIKQNNLRERRLKIMYRANAYMAEQNKKEKEKEDGKRNGN